MLKILPKFRLIDGLLVVGIILIAIGIGLNMKNSYADKNQVEVISKNENNIGQTEVQGDIKVTIDIEGEVNTPGIYSLKKGSRIGDVLIEAGGLNLNADKDWVEKNVNQAEILMDGQKIYIPKTGETVISNDQLLQSNSSKLINLNSAKTEDLDKLSGIGPAIAQRIIDYRNQNGGFKSVEEIKLVPGIGDKLFEKIKNQISI